jgi:hypothetical protein
MDHNHFKVLLIGGLLAGVCLFLGACKEEEKSPYANPTQIDIYFPLIKFLEEKTSALAGGEVSKTIAVNQESEEIIFKLSAEDWREELDVFFQADINKSALATAYRTSEEEGELVHTLKPGEKGTIKEIRVSKIADKVAAINVVSVRNNLFYHSEVVGKIQMDGQQENIASYSLSGRQKVWFLPETQLEVVANIRE